MSARGLAARLAVRSVRAAPGRSALIAAMIALPVAGAVMGGLVQASGHPTNLENITTDLGRAQARLQVVSTPDSSIEQDPVSLNWTNTASGKTSSTYRTPASALPAGTRIIPVFDANVTARTATGIGSMQGIVGTTWDPVFEGHWNVVAGSRPSGEDQIMVTRAALTRLGAKVGGTVQLLQPAEKTLTVAGVLDDRTMASSVAEVFGTAAALGATLPGLSNTSYYLPDRALSWADVQGLNKLGITAFSREVVQDPPPTPALVAQNSGGGSALTLAALIAVAVAFVLFEIVLLAGAAFAVTARQQQRWLAVVASVGSDRRTLVRIVTGAGVAIGLVGGVAGVALGLIAGTVAMALTSNGSATQFYGWHFPLLAVAISVAVAVFAGWLSALVPARAAAKADVLVALRGSRKPAANRRRTPILGIAIVALGAALTLWGGGLFASGVFQKTAEFPKDLTVGLLAAGPILMQIGALLATRLVLAVLARAASPLGVGLRLASRDLVRNRGRSVPAVAAIMATVFVGVFVMSLVGASAAYSAKTYGWSAQLGQISAELRYQSDPNASIADRVVKPSDAVGAAQTLGTGSVRVLRGVPDPDVSFTKKQLKATTLYPTLEMSCLLCDGTSGYENSLTSSGAHIYVGTASDIAAVVGHALSADAEHALANGGAVALDPHFVRSGHVTIGWWTAKQLNDGDEFPSAAGSKAPTRADELPTVTAYPAHTLPYGAFISPATAQKLGLKTLPTTLLVTPKVAPTQAQVDAFEAQMGALENSPGGIDYQWEQGPQDPTATVGWIAALACAVIVIAASAAAVGLSRIDNRPDADTLAAVGAPPAVQRRTAFWLALVVGGTGAVIGAGLALIPAVALGLPGSPLTFAPPWPPILVLALGIPVLIAAASWAIRPQRRQLSRRTAIA